MNSYLEEWCALTPACSNQAFNAINGEHSTWARLFPILCNHFNVPTKRDLFAGDSPRPRLQAPLDKPEPIGAELDCHSVTLLRNSLVVW
jgi:hypothetical protein